MTPTAAQDGRFRVNRIQKSLVARTERRVLDWLCAKLPAWVMPDHLTLLGVGGSVLVFLSYIASRSQPLFLWVASAGFVVHWFGDSLDGSLARHRRIERPIYGYFLDHTVDALCNLLIMAGIGFTLDVRMDVALFTLVGYYLLCMYVFINNHVSGVFQLGFMGFGPTELRLCLIAIDTCMYFAGRVGTTIDGQFFSYYDFVLLFAGVGFTTLFVARMLIGIRELRDPSRSGAAAPVPPVLFPTMPPQSASRKLSKASK